MKIILRRFLCFLLLTALLVLALPISGAALADTLPQPEAAAEALYALGLFQGTDKDSEGRPVFSLERAPTRNEAVAMLVRLLGKEAEAKSGDWTMPFVDVDDWVRPYVGYAFTHGLTTGTSGNTYGGGALIDAGQYLTFVLRALGYDDSRGDFAWDRAWELSDALGITDGSYGPDTGVFTRGDVAVISYAALSAPRKGSDETLSSTLFPSAPPEPPEIADSGSFAVHFLDVGQADCILVQCDGHSMLIDGGNAADSSLVYSYLQTHHVDYLDYIVCTHPHEDHVGGLAGALNYAAVGTALSPVTDYDSKVFHTFVNYLNARGVTITVPQAGDSFFLGSAGVSVLGPIQREVDDINNLSIVLRVTYQNTSFLFTGDAEREEEQDILAAGYDIRCNVLKVGHHGSAGSSSYPFLYYAQPEWGVISCGTGNSYGHPAEAALSRLRDAGVKLLRTDLQGHIVCTSDGTAVAFSVERNPDADTYAGLAASDPAVISPPVPAPASDTLPGASGESTYILNTNSHIFHFPSCSSAAKISEKNRQVFTGAREELIAMGYSPCGRCKP